MKRLFALIALLLASPSFAATLTSVQLLNPVGSVSGQVITSSGPTTPPAWVNQPGPIVTSVAGKIGAVTLLPSDVGAAALAGSASQSFAVANATTGQQAVNLGQMSSFPSSSGYQRFPGGLIIEWGSSPGIATGSYQPIAFPLAFPNGVFQVVVGSYSGSSNTFAYSLSAVSGSITTTGFNMTNNSSTSGAAIGSWTAFGN
jgi:hypothetical protein